MPPTTKNLALLQIRVLAGAFAPAFLVWLEGSFFGRIVNGFLQMIVARLNSKGITFLNVGVERIDKFLDQKNWDGTLEGAIKFVEEHNGNLTPEQIKAIDDKVIAAFDRSNDFRGTVLHDRGDSESLP